MKKYTRIDIKSVDDLPKKDGIYFVQIKGDYDIKEDIFRYEHMNSYVTEHWLLFVDWYLIEDTEKSYSEKFVKWKDKESTYIREDRYVFYSKSKTLSELFEYWLNEINNK